MNFIRPLYHYLWALGAALWYRSPARRLYLIGITGTKGKSTTSELINHILETAGKKTVLCSTIHFKVDGQELPNLKKMTMPGRGFIQKLLRQGLDAGCTHAIVEMTSQGVLQSRHRFLPLNALIFTNLTPEHIESHGSYEKYVAAKLQIANALARSPKPNKILIANTDSREADKFLRISLDPGGRKLTYDKSKIEEWMRAAGGQMPGEFNAYNILAAVTLARALGLKEEVIKNAIKSFPGARGRMEKVPAPANVKFDVIVDYAHTPESLEQVYQTYNGRRRLAVLGGTGGGRDGWKRPVMAGIAAKFCDQIFLTDEDPYDEEPRQIVEQMAAAIPPEKYQIIMDRRAAIRAALQTARPGDVILITGKGTDPYIMRARGAKEPWSDVQVATEELAKLNLA